MLDVAMPRLPETEILSQLRADARVGATPVIFLSATVGRQQVKGSQGMIDGHPFIAKPASVEEILDGIERHLVPSPGVAVSTAAHSAVGCSEVVALPEAPPRHTPLPPASPAGS